jgi:hypothetical protein
MRMDTAGLCLWDVSRYDDALRCVDEEAEAARQRLEVRLPEIQRAKQEGMRTDFENPESIPIQLRPKQEGVRDRLSRRQHRAQS